MAEKRYYWLKLKEDFFDDKYIRALRKMPNGDSLVIVYLRMQLKALKTDGIIHYAGLMPDNISELAMAIDEPEEAVRNTVDFLVRFGIVEIIDHDAFYITVMSELVGSEGSSAKRMRTLRAKPSLCDEHSSLCNDNVTLQPSHCYGEIEIKKEKETEIESDSESEIKKEGGIYGYSSKPF